MPNFCGKCGTPLDSSGQCPNCGFTANSSQDTSQTVFAQPPYPGSGDSPVPGVETFAKPKKSSKKLLIIIIAVVLAVCVLGGCVLAAFHFHWFGLGKSGSGENYSRSASFITKTSYGNYIGGVNLKYDKVDILHNDPEDGYVSALYSDGDTARVYTIRTAQDGDTFYGRVSDEGFLSVFTQTEENVFKAEKWTDDEQIRSDLGLSKGYFVNTMYYYQSSGDDVYALITRNLEYASSQPELNNRLVRLKKNGGKAEFVGGDDVRMSEFVIDGDWIYFASDGYFCNNGKMDYDENNIGIYKMKLDGSEKTLLYGEHMDDDNHYGNACNLSVYNGRLYFTDLSGSTAKENPLSRIGLDGTGYECLTAKNALLYAIDTDNNEIYYLDSRYPVDVNKGDICKYSLDTKAEQVVAAEKSLSNVSALEVLDGYLYGFLSGGQTFASRMDLSTGECGTLTLEYDSEKEYDEFGFAREINETKREYVWKESSVLG